MGQSVSAAREKAIDQGKVEEKMADDALNSLMDLADANHKVFEALVAAAGQNDKTVPIEQILFKSKEARASVDADTDNLADAVGTMLQQCASGEFLEAITTTVRSGLKALFGSYSGSKAIRQNYLVAVGPLGGIYRIDYFMYSYRFKSDTLVNLAKNVVLVAIVVSSAQISGLTRNTITNLVQAKFGSLPLEDQKKLRDSIWEEVQASREKRVMMDGLMQMQVNHMLRWPQPWEQTRAPI